MQGACRLRGGRVRSHAWYMVYVQGMCHTVGRVACGAPGHGLGCVFCLLMTRATPPAPPARKRSGAKGGGGRRHNVSDSLRAAHGQAENLQRLAVAAEYRDLGRVPPRHVFVMPSPQSFRVFHGVIFVVQGAYAGGVFRFKITLAEEYAHARACVSWVL